MSTLEGGGQIVTNGLVLCVDAANPNSYSGLGISWFDLSGNENNGLLINNPTFDNGNKGSILFDGVDDFVNCYTGVGKPTEFTISTWIKPNNWNNCGIVFSSNIGGGQAPTHWGLWGRYLGNVEIWVSDGVTYEFANTSLPWSSTYVPNTVFTNITVTVDTFNFKIFKNSIQIGLNIPQTIQQSGISYDLCIGANVADSGYFYDGFVSNAQIYNRALTSQEILQNYNTTKSRFGL